MYLSDDSRITARGNPIVHETLDGEAVIINLVSGTYYSLQGIGAILWQDVVASTTAGDLGRRLVAEADLAPDAARAAVDQFVAGLYGEALIAVDPAPANATPAVADLPGDLGQALTLQRFTDVQELLALDPVHDVDEVGWPVKAPATSL